MSQFESQTAQAVIGPDMTAFVTGASSGIGRALAVEIARRGMAISAVDIDRQALDDLGRELDGIGGRHLELVVDVSDADELVGAIERTRDELGDISLCAPFAGLFAAVGWPDIDAEMLEKSIAVNYSHVALACATLIRDQQRSSSYCNFLLAASDSAVHPTGELAPYSTAKGALLVMGLSLEQYCRANAETFGVTMAIISPTRTAFGSRTQAALGAELGSRIDAEGIDRFLGTGDSVDEVVRALITAVDARQTIVRTGRADSRALRSARWLLRPVYDRLPPLARVVFAPEVSS